MKIFEDPRYDPIRATILISIICLSVFFIYKFGFKRSPNNAQVYSQSVQNNVEERNYDDPFDFPSEAGSTTADENQPVPEVTKVIPKPKPSTKKTSSTTSTTSSTTTSTTGTQNDISTTSTGGTGVDNITTTGTGGDTENESTSPTGAGSDTTNTTSTGGDGASQTDSEPPLGETGGDASGGA